MPPKKSSKKSSKVTSKLTGKAFKATASKATAATSTNTAVETNPSSPIFFWREYGSEHSYLSQWYCSPFTTEDKSIVYQTAEQYMMYQKALLFNDPLIGSFILETTSPRDQKALGRQVKNFDEKTWLENRERIVEEGNYYKFLWGKGEGEGEEGDPTGLRRKLLATGDREIVEASPMDRIWGIGFGEKNAEARRGKWGLNLLGNALMRARERLRAEEERKFDEELDLTLCSEGDVECYVFL